MMITLGMLLLGVFSAQIYGAENRENIKPKQLVLSPENQYSAGVFDFNFLNPLQPSPQVPQYNFADPRDAVPRYQPQFLFYGGGPGQQPFLVNPGAPPNNFLYPQPAAPQGPGVIYRNSPQGPQPGRPVFFGGGVGGPEGFPSRKPAFVPPVEKDAEEVSTNPARIPPFKPKKPVGKPEKLETFNETPTATEADGLEETEQPQAQPKIPEINPANPKPGHRYFVLNGQPLFNYPFSLYQSQNINPEDVLRYSQGFPQTRPQEVPVPVIPVPQNPVLHNPQLQNPNFRNPDVPKPNFHNPAVFDGIKSDQNKGNGFPLNFDPYYRGNQDGFFQQSAQQPGIPSFLQNVPLKYFQSGVPGVQYNPQQQPQNIPQQNSQEIPLLRTNQVNQQKQLYFIRGQPNPTPSENTVANTENFQRQAPIGSFKSVLPLSVKPNEGQNVQIRVSTKDFNLQPVRPVENSAYSQNTDGVENDAIVIDAKYEDENKESEVVSAPVKQPQEPSLAQAGPNAIALAGPGGVAAAGPKATAFVGKEGMAVSSPKATAIAGPTEQDEGEEQDSKKDLQKNKKEKYLRQRFRGRYQ